MAPHCASRVGQIQEGLSLQPLSECLGTAAPVPPGRLAASVEGAEATEALRSHLAFLLA